MLVGVQRTGDVCEFVVWAPRRRSVHLVLDPQHAPGSVTIMKPDADGYWRAEVPDIRPGARYLFRLDNEVDRPDPASRFQPDGVHAPSEVIDHASFSWHDSAWAGIPLHRQIQYELHIGTFTPQGTFDASIPRLRDLADLGVNAVEIMPVAQFPGSRNWGYDGAYPYAVQNSYGGPDGLKRFVDAAHNIGLAVILDVVYNHLGPEGNYLHDYAPYFTEKYRSPWGWAINFDGPHSDHVRNYFIENALMWFRDYHIDALRLDAVHGIFDLSARPFLQVLAEQVDAYAVLAGRPCDLIAESDLNDTRVIRPRGRGGFGIPSQWSDDFHHALHTLLTGEKTGYYEDFGRVEDLVVALRDTFVYGGRYSRYRARNHGNPSVDCPAEQFVVFAQNHDQVGNRLKGDRLSTLVPFEALKLAAGAVLLSPYIPMLFMGEEYGEEAPFLYFVSHGDKDLVEAVRKGRREEFAAFGWSDEPPDPQSEETFARSHLNWASRAEGRHAALLSYYRTLISLRRSHPALAIPSKSGLAVYATDSPPLVICRRERDDSQVLVIMSFSDRQTSHLPDLPAGRWRKTLDSADPAWHGPGPCLDPVLSQGTTLALSPWNFALFLKEGTG